jgi:hypothetical protein
MEPAPPCGLAEYPDQLHDQAHSIIGRVSLRLSCKSILFLSWEEVWICSLENVASLFLMIVCSVRYKSPIKYEKLTILTV